MNFLFLLLIVSMGAALGALALGLISMLKGGDFNQKYANKLMVARVACQALAVCTLGLIFLLGN